MAVGVLATGAACSPATDRALAEEPAPAPTRTPEDPAVAGHGPTPAPEVPAEPASAPTAGVAPYARPAWLGTRVLERRADGFGVVTPTPVDLVDRRLEPPSHLADPPADAAFDATVQEVPADVLARSTWHDGCPVARDDLAYLTLTFWGFDELPHTGELLVHRDVATTVVELFRQLYEQRFPIEEMRVVHADELDLAPTGDGNNTTAFVCRATRGSGSWSAHARGLAIDVNPFHNPYVKDDVVLPELASAYLDRDHRRPGMLHDDGDQVHVFESAGWTWGGRWTRPVDWMHFSFTGR